MIALFAIAVASTFLALVLASQLPSPTWLLALDAVACCSSVALLAGVAALLSRANLSERYRSLALPTVAAVVALLSRRWLIAWLSPPEALPRIDYWRLQLAALCLVASTFALIGGIAAMCRACPWPQLAVAGLTVAVALFGLGPVLLRSGVPLDHRTFLSLAGLGVGAYAVVEGARKLGGRRAR